VPLVLVTGVPGSGKSAVLAELPARGFDAYGADKDNWARWEDRETREVVAMHTTADMRTEQWRSDNEWYASRTLIEELVSRTLNATTFLCGFVANETEIWDLFSEHVYLSVDESTLRERIMSRTDNDFGKSAREFSEILGMCAKADEKYRRLNVTMIDARRPVNAVVDDLLVHVLSDQDPG